MPRKHTRYIIAVLVGIAASIATGLISKWSLAPLAGWDGAAIVLTVLIWHDMQRKSAQELSSAVRRDDMRGALLDAVVLLASIASIVAAVLLISGKEAGVMHMLFALFSIVTSWACVHTLYALRYSELFYRRTEGGIDFNEDAKPRFLEFAYFSFTVGMTYQVSDTNITDAKIRHAVLGHALLSFLFGMAIIATSINSIVSIANG